MPDRGAIAVVVWLIGVSAAAAQPPAHGDSVLPPLLPVPTGPGTPAPCCPTPMDESGKPLEYDRSLMYLPDRHPGHNRPFESRPRDERATWGRAAALYGQTQSLETAGLPDGSNKLQPNWRAGIDAAAGVWWDSERSRGTEFGALYLAEGHISHGLAESETRFLSANGHYRQSVGRVWKIKLDAFTGYRFASVSEETTPSRTENHFHGGTLGLDGEYRHGAWSADARASIALGATFADQVGFMARNERTFAVLPELSMSLGREVFDSGRVFLGYRFVQLNHLIRPTTAANSWSSFWMQGVTVGFDWWF
jgi:hypothetical protein